MRSTATGFLCFCLVAGLASATFAGVDLTPYDLTGCVSVDTPPTECNVTFSNESGVAVNIYWIDQSGTEIFYGQLSPGSSYIQGTYLNHIWLVRRDSDNAALEGFDPVTASPFATPDPDVAHILGSTGPFERLCAPVATESSTWSGIKSLHRN